MHPLHQAIKEAEERRSTTNGLSILFGVPLGLCYLVALVFPFLALRNENVDGITVGILSFLNVICGAVIGISAGIVFAWRKCKKHAIRFLAGGLVLHLFAAVMFKTAMLAYGIPRGKIIVVGR